MPHSRTKTTNSRTICRKQALLNRLDNALRDMYHNATPHSPSVPESLYERYNASFQRWAEDEVEYIEDGLGRTANDYKKEAKKGWPHKGERNAWLVQSITDYGKLYTWGRGGRTLAPQSLISQRGGSSFSIKNADNYSDFSNEALTHKIQVIEAFNAYVTQWNSKENLAYLWGEDLLNERVELAACAKSTRKDLKKLAIEARALAGIAGDSACSVLRAEISRLKHHHKILMQELRKHNEAIKEIAFITKG